MRKLLFFFFIFLFKELIDQQNFGQLILDSAVKSSGAFFVHIKPTKEIRLEISELKELFFDYKADTGLELDTNMIKEILINAREIDTTEWQEFEFKSCIILKERDETVLKKNVLEKFKSTQKMEKEHLLKVVRKFNNTFTSDRNIFYFSRPVFDNSKKFAVIQWDNGHSFLGGGGSLVLYHRVNETWKEFGVLSLWRY